MIDPTIDPKARRRYAAGRRIKVPKQIRTVRDLIRQHLYDARIHTKDIAPWWNVKRETVKTIMHHGRPIAPQYIDAFIEHMKLDEFDANEMRVMGAIEAGWNINVKLFKEMP